MIAAVQRGDRTEAQALITDRARPQFDALRQAVGDLQSDDPGHPQTTPWSTRDTSSTLLSC